MSKQDYRFYVAYEDDGPIGPCVQCATVTSPWKKLYIFNDYDSLKKFYFNVENKKGSRKNPRIVGLWEECIGMPELSNVIYHND